MHSEPESAPVRFPSYLSALLVAACIACDGTADVDLLTLAPQTVRVGETLAVPLLVRNDSGLALDITVRADSVIGFESTAVVSSSPSGGELRWTPLASHVGTHEIVVELRSSGAILDAERMLVSVEPSNDAAPVFVRPGAGGTHDLIREPCVEFDIEVRDDDSASVIIRARRELPSGANLSTLGPKSAIFEWCPTRDQIASSARWNIALEADDGEHDPVPHDYIAVLRASAATSCPNEPPFIGFVRPVPGAILTGAPEVAIQVTDDLGIRDTPLLYWSTEAPANPKDPDLTTYRQVQFEAVGPEWVAAIPLELPTEGMETTVYFVATATDNDDATGTACDHTTDSELREVVVRGTSIGPSLGQCATCTRSSDCASGICAQGLPASRCLTSCLATPCSVGICGEQRTVEGSSGTACGALDAVCGAPMPTCVDDSRESNDTTRTATMVDPQVGTPETLTNLQICAGNDDFFAIRGSARDELTILIDDFVAADGDLDLNLLDASGTILASSASASEDSEEVTYCLPSSDPVFAQVVGYDNAQNGYRLAVSRVATDCCSEDRGEPDNSVASARILDVGTTTFAGTVCPDNEDFIGIRVDSAAEIRLTLDFDGSAGDIDLALLDANGTQLGTSTGITDIETIRLNVMTAGVYIARIYGFRGAENQYTGSFAITPIITCAATRECPSGQICRDARCSDDACTSVAQCPAMHLCPASGPGSATRHCGALCQVNGDCRASEACKWLAEGRSCHEKGSGANGGACATYADCGGQRTCLPTTGGYCARAGCSTNSDCEAGTYCASIAGINACVLGCESDPTRCRTGYACRSVADSSGASRLACLP